jgi:hypothetical protein
LAACPSPSDIVGREPTTSVWAPMARSARVEARLAA